MLNSVLLGRLRFLFVVIFKMCYVYIQGLMMDMHWQGHKWLINYNIEAGSYALPDLLSISWKQNLVIDALVLS